jgi:predicted Zn-dependent protease
VSVLTGDPDAAAAIAGGALTTSTRSLLSFSRAQEGSADQAGYSFLKNSGKSLCGIISFLELLENMQISYQENAYTQSHPLTRERINDAKNAAKDENCEIKNSELLIDEKYKFIQAKLIGFADPENTLISIKNNSKFNDDQKNYALAIANYKLFNLKKGNELINKLIKKYPSNPYFYELKAQMLRENGFLKESLNNYLIVNKLIPNDPLVQIELAHTLLNLDSKKNLDKAIQNLEEAKKKEPENNKLWYLLSVARGKNSEMGESRYASAYSFYLKGDDAMALSFIERAKKITKRNSSTWTKLINLENKINFKKK